MITNNDIRKYLGIGITDKVIEIKQVDSLGDNKNTLMFVNYGVSFQEGSQNVYIVPANYYPNRTAHDNNDFIFTQNPKYLFCKIVEHFNLRSRLQIEFQFTPNYYHESLMYRNVLHCDEFIIGNRCQFDPGVILGGTDFSPVMGDSRDELIQFPQMGGICIGNNVVIKYNSMVGKGTFGYTTIGDNTMIDYGCQIGHNCIIGNACIIAAGTIIGGSTVIGDNTTIGIGATIRNGIKIGNNVSVGMGAVVIKDIPDNCVVVGNPARIIEHKQIFDKGGLI